MVDLSNVVDYLNKRFSQDSEEYSIFMGAKPQVIRFDNKTAISLWACGAIVCIGRGVYFIQEDDGNWYAPKYTELDRVRDEESLDFWKKHSEVGLQTSFSMGWADSFIKAFTALRDYMEKEGTPYYYSLGTDEYGNTIWSAAVCGYELK